MSHFSAVPTKLTDIDLIEAAMKSIGLKAVRSGLIRGYHKSAIRADIVAVLNGEFDLGYQHDGGVYNVVADFSLGSCGGGDATLAGLHEKIVATYAALNARKQAEANRALARSKVNVIVH